MAERKNIKKSDLESRLAAKAAKDEVYRRRLFADPKSVIEAEMGEKLPPDVKIQLVEDTGDTIHFVLPNITGAPAGELSDDALANVAGGIAATLSRSSYGIVAYGTSGPTTAQCSFCDGTCD